MVFEEGEEITQSNEKGTAYRLIRVTSGSFCCLEILRPEFSEKRSPEAEINKFYEKVSLKGLFQ